MKKRNFSEWFKTFRSSIRSYEYYVNFQKVYSNVESLKIEINILNTLIGANNIEEEFEKIITKYPECLKAIPILLAVRQNEIYCQDEKGAINYCFKKQMQSIDQYKYFMRETGLFDMLQNHIINNLYDYVTGVEVGLDSNGRKNRGGDEMEDLVESYLKKENLKYIPELNLSEIENRWGIDLSPISAGGTTEKRWDFVVKTPEYISVIETNFYTTSGSKLNEVSRSYKMIAEESAGINGFRFIWVTDGGGWEYAKKNLKETFDVLDTLYNITDLENGAFSKLFSK